MTPEQHAKAIEDAARKVTQASIDYMVDSGLAYKLGRAESALQAAIRAGVGAADSTVYDHGPQANSVQEAARDVAKWLNERPNRPLDLRHVAMLTHHASLAPEVKAAPEGWQTVPVVPTREMMLAATEIEVDCDAGGSQNIYGSEAMNIYRTMLAAAPKP